MIIVIMASVSNKKMKNRPPLQHIQENLNSLKDLEAQLENTQVVLKNKKDKNTQLDNNDNQDSDTQLSNASSTSTTSSTEAVLDRYRHAKQLYLQRRLENLLMQHVTTFDPATNSFEFPVNDDDDNDNNVDLQEQLQILQSMAQSAANTSRSIQESYQTVVQRRQELEQMMQDMLENNKNDMDDAKEEMEEDVVVSDADLDREQQRVDALQQEKLRLQHELAAIEEETKQVQEQARLNQQKIVDLDRQLVEVNNVATVDGDDSSSKELPEKIAKLHEIKEWYDSLRGVIEELGSVKIDSLTKSLDNKRLKLTLCVCGEFGLVMELKRQGRSDLKLVTAYWSPSTPKEITVTRPEPFSLKLSNLDNIVRVATTVFPPTEDVRHVLREARHLIRFTQDRANDLSILRTKVLTKVVGDQVVCSLPEGLVLAMRYYDSHCILEQVVGVSGWDGSRLQELETASQAKYKNKAGVRASELVHQIQSQLKEWQAQGVGFPKTPALPSKKFFA